MKQFTAGALVVDDYAIPSFYLCEYGLGYDLFINLYTYSKDSETWSLDNHSLRKFNNGVYTYKLSRIFKRMQNTNKLDVDRYTEFITKMNKMYEIKYNSRNIISNNFDGYDTFDVSKIIGSLSNINMPYEKAIDIAFKVVTQITSNDFKANGDYLSCTELRHIIYQKIISQKSTKNDKEFSISCWASRYARKYNRNSEIIIQMQNNRTEKMNYAYVQNTLLKHIFDEVTGNEIFYLKTSKKELQRMSERILDFLRNMGIFEVREEVLDSLIIEYITQKPHPWLVHNNSKQLLVYHTHQAEEHINKLKRNEVSIISQTEAAYHISAAFLVQYDKVIGCTETSPISIIKNTVNRMCNEENMILNRLPMQKYQIIQLKKDLKKQSIDFKKFIAKINVVYDFIIDKQEVTNEKTKIALIDLWDMLRKLEQKNSYDNQRNKENSIERIRYVFEEGTGFIVKAPLQALKSCFWIEPNWEEYEIKQQHLGEQALVCVIDIISDVDDVHKYLFSDGRELNSRTTELIFAYNSYKSFSKEDRNAIREKFRGKAIKCIFVQEENYSMISENQNWREILFDVIRISRLS